MGSNQFLRICLVLGSCVLGLMPLCPTLVFVGFPLFLLGSVGLTFVKVRKGRLRMRHGLAPIVVASLLLIAGLVGGYTSGSIELAVGGTTAAIVLSACAIATPVSMAWRVNIGFLAGATCACIVMLIRGYMVDIGETGYWIAPYILLTSSSLLATTLRANGNSLVDSGQISCLSAKHLRWFDLGLAILMVILLISTGYLWILPLLPIAFFPVLLWAIGCIHWPIGRLSVWVLLTILWLFQLSYAAHIADSYFVQRELPKSQLPLLTKNGHRYTHDTLRQEYQNGYQTWLYVCPEELRAEWSKRSTRPYDSLAETLICYLTSLGHRKDSVGMTFLTQADIAAIEHGTYNANLRGRHGIYLAVWHECEALESYIHGGTIRTPLVRLFDETRWAALHLTAKGAGVHETHDKIPYALSAWQLPYALGYWIAPLVWLAFLLLGVAALRRGNRWLVCLLLAWLVGMFAGSNALSLSYWLFSMTALGLAWGLDGETSGEPASSYCATQYR